MLNSIQAVDVEAVAVTVKELVSYALTLNPNNQSWLITQADIYFGKKKPALSLYVCVCVEGNRYEMIIPSISSLSLVTNQYSAALNLYLQAGAVCSDFFTKAVPPDVYSDQVNHALCN